MDGCMDGRTDGHATVKSGSNYGNRNSCGHTKYQGGMMYEDNVFKIPATAHKPRTASRRWCCSGRYLDQFPGLEFCSLWSGRSV